MMILMSIISFLSMLLMGYFLRILFPLLKDKHQEKRQNYLEILSLLNAGEVKKASDYAALTAPHDIYQAIKSMEHDKTLSHTDIVAMMRKELRIK
ncbi:hypothetical protein F0225_17485 [Vibrio pectenicida]|uniref:Uncharacterized protein n=1 Tax=Vibrio pectenicida TaxID=62763 RepID=A0A7Y4EEU1_9VIBR|nr:hypothetical protein [Vibrio pectenicida]NOH73115.1 hypothetical protein [Vibrio pectenicida]